MGDDREVFWGVDSMKKKTGFAWHLLFLQIFILAGICL